jgi:antitoxin ParD1/3/4
MTELHITLPDDAANYVEAQVAQGKFASASDVLVDAIEAKRVQAARERLAELIREGMDSGPGREVIDEDQWWAELDAKIQAELNRRQTV